MFFWFPSSRYFCHHIVTGRITSNTRSMLYFPEEFRIFRYFPVAPRGTMLPYATIKRKINKKEGQMNVSLPALQLIYIRISYVGLP